jgi:hypothetical protein
MLLRAGFLKEKKVITLWSQLFLRSFGTTSAPTFKWKGIGIPTRPSSEMLGKNGNDCKIKLHRKRYYKNQICV